MLGVAGDWKVVDVVPPRLVEAPKGPTPSDALGPEHGQEDLLAFVRSIYLNVHKACGEGKLSTIRNVLTSEMRDGIARDPEAHSRGIPIHRVDRMDIVAVQRGALDVITVRIEAVTEGGPFVEDWMATHPVVVRALQSRAGRRGCVLLVVVGLAITAALLVGVFVYLTP